LFLPSISFFCFLYLFSLFSCSFCPCFLFFLISSHFSCTLLFFVFFFTFISL
jgi:hypothetical protein